MLRTNKNRRVRLSCGWVVIINRMVRTESVKRSHLCLVLKEAKGLAVHRVGLYSRKFVFSTLETPEKKNVKKICKCWLLCVTFVCYICVTNVLHLFQSLVLISRFGSSLPPALESLLLISLNIA